MKKYPQALKDNLILLKNKREIFKVSVCNNPNNPFYKIKQDVMQYTEFLDKYNPKFAERVYAVLNNIYEYKVCQCGCGQKVKDLRHDFYSRNCLNKAKIILEKRKQTCLKKYGVVHQSKSLLIKQKKIETSKRKYGTEYPIQHEAIKYKSVETNFKNHNGIFSTACKDVKEKREQTCLNKYGVKNPNQSDIVKNKKATTCLKNYGVVHPSHSEEIRYKALQTSLNKYGTKYPIQLDSFKEKSRHQIYCNFYNSLFSNRLKHKFLPLFDISEYHGVNKKYKFKCLTCGNIVHSHLDNGHIPRCLICNPYKNSNSEQELKIFIKNLQLDIYENIRTLIPPYELDIYIPDKRVAIEFNGLYWHSELQGKDQNYHLNKTIMCEEQGIQLIHIFEDEWKYKKQIVKNRLKHILGLTKYKICDMNFSIKEVDITTKNKFLEKYHIQGPDISSIRLGAYYKNRLVAVMTFGKKDSNAGEYELLRFCTLGNFNVVGIASKLLKHFERNYLPSTIIRYADRRWSNGNLYKQLGFELSHITEPNYWCLHESYKIRKPDCVYGSKLSEEQNSQINYDDRIFDCGNYIFIKKI